MRAYLGSVSVFLALTLTQHVNATEVFAIAAAERERAKVLWNYSLLKCLDSLPILNMYSSSRVGLITHPTEMGWCNLLKDLHTSQVESRAVATRKRDTKTPTWTAAQIPAFIVDPEVWHFDPSRREYLPALSWPINGIEALKLAEPVVANQRRTFGEYLLNPDPNERWIFNLPNIYFEY